MNRLRRVRIREPYLARGREHDRAILALAVPALGALAADPLYSVVDTAFVGRLGTPQLGAVAIGSAAFTASFWLFSFLAYGVTPRVARALGRNDRGAADRIGIQALLLAAGLGTVVSLAGLILAGPVVRALGASGAVEGFAEPYLRIRVLAAVPVLIAQVGHGWLRGFQNTRTPMAIALSGAGLNVVLDYVLIYPAGLGIEGAALATVIGQGLVAAAFVVGLLSRMGSRRLRIDASVMRSLLIVGADLGVRTGSLLAALTIATSVAARMGGVELAAWQIAMQLFLLLALALDAVAIAAQAMIGRFLGAGDPSAANHLARRLLMWGLLGGVVLCLVVVPTYRLVAGVFSEDPAVVDRAAALLVWLGLIQPLSAVAFTLDGILIGASDTRFLAVSMVGSSLVFVLVALGSLEFGWGLAGLAMGATLWFLARVGTTGVRYAGGRWALQP